MHNEKPFWMPTLQTCTLHALCLNNTSTATVGEPFGALYVRRDASFEGGSSGSLFVALLCLCLSISGGPMGEATVASHVFLLANDKVAATASMNYAGRRGSNSTPGYVNLSLRRLGGAVDNHFWVDGDVAWYSASRDMEVS